MRIMIGMALLLAVILVFSFYMLAQVSQISEDLTLTLDTLEKRVEDEQWEEASRTIEVLQQNWTKAIVWWNPLMDHREIDLLDHSIAKLAKQVDLEQKEDVLVEISLARRMAHRLKDREKLLISNIF